MNRIVAALCAAFLLFLPNLAGAAPGSQKNTLGVRNWYVPNTAITGFTMQVVGGQLQITPTTATLEGAAAGTVRLAIPIAEAALGATPGCLTSECNPDLLFSKSQEASWMIRNQFERDVADRASYDLIAWSDPDISYDTIGRQSRLTNKWPAPAGFVSLIDLIDQMNPQPNAQQLEALKKLAESEPLMPGRAYVTLDLSWNPNAGDDRTGAFMLDRAFWTFEPDGNAILDNLAVCPPGTEGTPPNCTPKEEPPPGAPPQEEQSCAYGVCSDPGCPPPLPDGTRWIRDPNTGSCVIWTPPAGCPTCGPIDPEGRVKLIR